MLIISENLSLVRFLRNNKNLDDWMNSSEEYQILNKNKENYDLSKMSYFTEHIDDEKAEKKSENFNNFTSLSKSSSSGSSSSDSSSGSDEENSSELNTIKKTKSKKNKYVLNVCFSY